MKIQHCQLLRRYDYWFHKDKPAGRNLLKNIKYVKTNLAFILK